MNTEINCQFCRYYEDGYCEVLELEPCYPQKGCEYFSEVGRWIDDKCSICGKGTEDLISSREWYRNEEPNFCPFCGVKIESQESEVSA